MMSTSISYTASAVGCPLPIGQLTLMDSNQHPFKNLFYLDFLGRGLLFGRLLGGSEVLAALVIAATRLPCLYTLQRNSHTRFNALP